MIQGIYSATAGMINQQTAMGVITNNLANVSTPGYKRDEVSFSGMFNSLPTPEEYIANPLGLANLDTVTAKFATDHSQAGMINTGNPLDLALDGSGFFVIQHAEGIRYTRSGNFSLDNSGQLVTIDGYPVLGVNGVINIPVAQSEQMRIDSAGRIIIDDLQVDQLRLSDFQDESELVKSGGNNFAPRDANSAEIPATAEIRQGYLERSNVNPVYEMVKMIESMRIYESYQKTVQSINDTLEQANRQLAKVSV